jgi:hypothetical protein
MPLPSNLSDAANLSTIFSTLISLVATMIGAVWVVHTWRQQEWLRREEETRQTYLRKQEEALRQEKENPGIEIDLICRQDPLPDGRVLLTMDYAVRNTGVLPIEPIITEASYAIGEIPLATASGFLTRDFPVKMINIPCMPHRQEIRLEPKTATIFTAQYLAAPGHLYAVAFSLPSKELMKNGERWVWSRWRAIFVPGLVTAPPTSTA